MLQNAETRPLVLIVDDDRAVRESLAEVMEAFGFRTRTASNGAEGLAAVAVECPAAIITDLQMPRMGGLELISALRRTRTGIPVIVISGGDVEVARRSGAAATFHKPLAVGEVIDAVCDLTQRAA
jgi:two-component system, OmpR family, response regulator MprA